MQHHFFYSRTQIKKCSENSFNTLSIRYVTVHRTPSGFYMQRPVRPSSVYQPGNRTGMTFSSKACIGAEEEMRVGIARLVYAGGRR